MYYSSATIIDSNIDIERETVTRRRPLVTSVACQLYDSINEDQVDIPTRWWVVRTFHLSQGYYIIVYYNHPHLSSETEYL